MHLQNVPGPSTNVSVSLSHTARYDWNSDVEGGYAEVVVDGNDNLVLVATVICRDNLLESSEQKSPVGTRVFSPEPVPITVRVTVDGDPYDEEADTVIVFP